MLRMQRKKKKKTNSATLVQAFLAVANQVLLATSAPFGLQEHYLT